MPFRKTRPRIVLPDSSVQVDITDPLARGLVGAWPLNEGAGTIAGDITRRQNGTVTGSPTWVGGRNGKALQFSASSQYVQLNNALINLAAFTFSAWVFPTTLTNGGVYAIIGGGSIVVTAGPEFRLDGQVGGVTAKVSLIKQGVAGVGSSTGTVALGVWSHVAVTYDGVNYAFYINGAPSGSGAVGATLGASSGNALIGLANPSPAEGFLGRIADVRIANVVHKAPLMAAMFAEPWRPFVVPRRRIISGAAAVAFTADGWQAQGAQFLAKPIARAVGGVPT